MKLFYIFIMLCLSPLLHSQQSYEQCIAKHATSWKEAHIGLLQKSNHIQTLIDIILLCYQLSTESCKMANAKLTIQQELLKLYTPSLSDSWQTNMKIKNNDTTTLEQAIQDIKHSQIILQRILNDLIHTAPQLVQINPQPTQTLIADLKNSLIAWGKEQKEITQQLSDIQDEFLLAIATISDIKTIFETIFQTSKYHHVHLKEAAGCVCKTYKDIEYVIAHLTHVRKESIFKIQRFFVVFFKTYYLMMLELLTPDQIKNYSTHTTPDGKLPLPDAFFV